MGSDHRGPGEADDVIERFIGSMGNIDHDPEAVHLLHDFFAERGKSVKFRSGRIGG